MATVREAPPTSVAGHARVLVVSIGLVLVVLGICVAAPHQHMSRAEFLFFVLAGSIAALPVVVFWERRLYRILAVVWGVTFVLAGAVLMYPPLMLMVVPVVASAYFGASPVDAASLSVLALGVIGSAALAVGFGFGLVPERGTALTICAQPDLLWTEQASRITATHSDRGWDFLPGVDGVANSRTAEVVTFLPFASHDQIARVRRNALAYPGVLSATVGRNSCRQPALTR